MAMVTAMVMDIMKNQAISSNKKKVFSWIKLITITGGAQIIMQTLGFVSGIIVIRLLPTSEYAFYTLANTMLGTMTILADGGIGAAVMSLGGKVWNDKQSLGVVLTSGFELRKKFAIFSIIIAIPFLIYLLQLHHASGLLTFLIIIALIPAFLTALSNNLLEIAPKLKQDIIPLQINQIQVSFGRLILIGLTLFVFPWAFLAIFVGGVAQIFGNIRLRKISAKHALWGQKSDPLVQQKILVFVKRILPSSVYYCISGQITIWIISAFGTTESVAQVGALSRLSAMISVFGILFSTLVVPRFTRLPDIKNVIIKKIILIQGGLFVLGFAIVGFVALFSKQILWILGSGFTGLTTEVILIVTGSCISFISISTNQLLVARGILVSPVIIISLSVIVQVCVALFMDLSKVENVMMFAIFTSLVLYLTRIFYLILFLGKHEFNPEV